MVPGEGQLVASVWGFIMLFCLQNRNNHDMNVRPVWDQGITGKGVVVSILDDGKLFCSNINIVCMYTAIYIHFKHCENLSLLYGCIFIYYLGLEHTHHDLRDNYVSELHITSQPL